VPTESEGEKMDVYDVGAVDINIDASMIPPM